MIHFLSLFLLPLAQAQTKVSETAEPQVVEPEAVEPEAVEPEAVEPEAVEPEAVEPEAVEPEAVEPEAVEPEAVEPEAVEPEAVEPEAVEPEATEPEATEPEPASTQTQAAEWNRRWLVNIYGGALTGYTSLGFAAAVTGDMVSDEVGPLLQPIGLLGAGTTALLTRKKHYSSDQFATLVSGGMLGGWFGAELGRALIGHEEVGAVARTLMASNLGALSGTGLAILAFENPMDSRQAWMFDVTTLVGWQIGAGAGDLLGLDYGEDRTTRGLMELGTGAVLGLASTRFAEGSLPKAGPLGIAMAHGTWAGTWAPVLMSDNPSTQQVLGGLRMGLGAGYLGGLALSRALGPQSFQDLLLQGAGWGAGASLGAGVPMLLGVDETRQVVGPMLAGGLAGHVAGAVLSPQYNANGKDLAFTALLEAWTGYQSIGWALYMDEAHAYDSRAAAGGFLTTAGAGTLTAFILPTQVDLEIAETTMVASAGGWGTWYGGWIGELVDLDPQQHLLAFLGAGDVALLGTAVLANGSWNPDWSDVGTINGAGLAGGAIGAMAGVVASPERKALAGGALVGSTAGLGIGWWLTQNGTSDATSASWMPGLPQRLGSRFPRTHLRALPTLAPWMDSDGNPGAWLQLVVLQTGK